MKIKYLLVAVAMIGLTSFSMPFGRNLYRAFKTKLKIQISEGEKLIAKSDCIGCHNKDKKVVGPSYVDIANKYAATDKNIIYLDKYKRRFVYGEIYQWVLILHLTKMKLNQWLNTFYH
jgi:cytochrome c